MPGAVRNSLYKHGNAAEWAPQDPPFGALPVSQSLCCDFSPYSRYAFKVAPWSWLTG